GNGNTARAQSRKVASALRHRYQLEYQFSEPTVVFDVINAILAHVGRNNSQFAPSEKEMMEKFFHELFGGLFGLENPAAVSSPTEDEAVADVEIEAEAETKVEVLTESDAGSAIAAVSSPVCDATADGHVVPEAEANSAAAASPAAVNGGVSPAGEKARDDAVTEGQDKSGPDAMEVDQDASLAAASSSAVKAQHNGDNAVSKPSTPGLISSRSWIQIGSSKHDTSAAPATGLPSKSVSRAFYTNSSYYVFLRLFQILYERFSKLRELGPECQGKVQQAQQAQSVATKLGMRAQSEVLKGYDLENTDFYAIFLELVDQFLQGQLDTNSFDEGMRVLYGTHAYRILTVDKVMQAVSKNIQHLISDGRCVDILELFTTLPAVHELSPLRSHIAYRMKVEALVGADEHVFRVGYIYSSQTMAIQLLRREDITLDEAVTEEERWAYYVDSYVLFEPTEGVGRATQERPRPYLSRHLHPDECDYVISSRSNLEIKIAVNTYKLCFLTGTEDIYANHSRRAKLLLPLQGEKEEEGESVTSASALNASAVAARKAYNEAWSERTGKWHEW
ncbi:hypothetical protein GGF37_006180, partial [Kickxella alabastrina]